MEQSTTFGPTLVTWEDVICRNKKDYSQDEAKELLDYIKMEDEKKLEERKISLYINTFRCYLKLQDFFKESKENDYSIHCIEKILNELKQSISDFKEFEFTVKFDFKTFENEIS